MKANCTILILILMLSCKTSSKENELAQYMLGGWETQYLKIEMPTVNKTDSLSVFEDDFSKPNAGKAQSKYNKDGTFSAWFTLANGEKIDETKGLWSTKGDSLFVDYQYAGKQVKAWYLITKTSEGFDGKVIYDWDNDGEFDDKLFMKTKRIVLP